MSLIKCSECGQDVSTEALTCPHCGKPNIPTVSEEIKEEVIPDPINVTKATTIGTLIILLLISAYFYFQPAPTSGHSHALTLEEINQHIQQQSLDIVLAQNSSIISRDDPNEVKLQQVKNLGYTFLLGEIESQSVTNINDDLKNQITKIAYNAHFPASRLQNIPIIILNNLALTGSQYIVVNGVNLKVPTLTPEFLSIGGMYTTFSTGQAIIFINKPIIAQGLLTRVLTHEFGHAVGSTLSDQEWATFYKLRKIPANTPLRATNWDMPPQEDFAEVYKNTFTNLAVRTSFGIFVTQNGSLDLGPCSRIVSTAQTNYKNQAQQTNKSSSTANTFTSQMFTEAEQKWVDGDTTVQSCRRKAMTDTSEEAKNWRMFMPYITTVDIDTKNFISNIMSKLN